MVPDKTMYLNFIKYLNKIIIFKFNVPNYFSDTYYILIIILKFGIHIYRLNFYQLTAKQSISAKDWLIQILNGFLKEFEPQGVA